MQYYSKTKMAGSNKGKTNAKYPSPTDNRTQTTGRSNVYYSRNEMPSGRFESFENIFLEDDNNNDDDDDEDDDYFPENPSGSVLQPVQNPYDKEQRIVEANEVLFSEPLARKSPQKVTFSRVEKRYSYYSQDLYETDSLTSSDSSEVFVGEGRISHIPSQQESTPREGIINSNLLLVLVKAENTSGNEDFESEDMYVGIYRKASDSDNINTGYGYSDEKQCSQREETRQKVESAKKEINIEGGVYSDECFQEIIECENELTDKHLNDDIYNETASGITIKITNFDSFNYNNDLEKNSKLNVYIPLSDANCNYELFEDCTLPFQSDVRSKNNTNDIEEEVEEENVEDEKCGDNVANKEENKHDVKLQHWTEEEKTENENNQVTCDKNQEQETEKEHEVENEKEPKVEQQSSRVQKKSIKSKVLKSHKKVSENNKLIGEKISLDLNKKERLGDNFKARISVCTKSSDKKMFNINQKVMIGADKTGDETQDKDQSKSTVFKNKSKSSDKSNAEIKNKMCCSNNKKFNRPKSCVEKKSVPITSSVPARPLTAPACRTCCQWGQPRLPEYNGLRSEYGLSAEQLQERKRIRKESLKEKHEHKVQKRIEEQQKRRENEAKFCAWLEGKRQQAKLRYIRNQKIKAASSQPYYAPTGHLKKIGVFPRPKKPLKSETMYYLSLDQLLNSAKNGERKTYKIYLGLPVV